MTEDPEVLIRRKIVKREQSRIRMRNHRARVKAAVGSLLNEALTTTTSSNAAPNGAYTPTGDARSLAEKTARGILKNLLRQEGVTLQRVVRVISEGLSSVRITKGPGRIAQLPDHTTRLKSANASIEMLQLAGELMTQEKSAIQPPINFNVLMMPEKRIRTIETDAQSADDDKETP
jgi:hypothetical protein